MKPILDRVLLTLRIYKYEYILIAVAFLTLVGAVIVLVYDLGPITADDELTTALSTTKPPEDSESYIWVDVAGAVKHSGLYKLPAHARVQDAITKAGGLDPHVDYPYFMKNTNLARVLKDEEKIYIPSLQDRSLSTSYSDLSTDNELMKTSLNTASQSELESLPGIGPATASKIIQARPYSTIERLAAEKIVNSATFEKIKSLITL